jgi:hypothetical protein
MYHSNTYLPSKGDAPHAWMGGMDDDIPILELERNDGMSGLALQFDIDTPAGTAFTIAYLLDVERKAKWLREMVEARQQEAAS